VVRGVRRVAVPLTLLETIGYDELCIEVDVADLARAGRNAIAHVAAAARCDPDPPVDLAGIIGSVSRETQPVRASGYEERVVLGEPETPRGLVGRANDPQTWWAAPFQSPALYAAALRDVLCFGGLPAGAHSSGHTLVVGDRFIVPDSYFLRNTVRSLPADLLTAVGAPANGRYRMQVDVTDVPTEPGLYYFAGAAFGHFGHFLLEGLSRWWLLALLPEPVRAQLRFVLYDQQPLHSWQLEMLERLGVAADRLLYLTEPLRFERLIVPAPAYHLHRGGASVQRDTWERIGSAFDRGSGPARVYLSRSRHRRNRVLIDEAALERSFAARGFVVLHPQELSVAEQVATIRHARLIAGSAGSAMYLSAFAREGARKLIVAPRDFAFRDDQVISFLRGGELAYVLCDRGADGGHPRDGAYRVAPAVLADALDRWAADDG
jgi:capsular polysaccharide biosynthesis protein